MGRASGRTHASGNTGRRNSEAESTENPADNGYNNYFLTGFLDSAALSTFATTLEYARAAEGSASRSEWLAPEGLARADAAPLRCDFEADGHYPGDGGRGSFGEQYWPLAQAFVAAGYRSCFSDQRTPTLRLGVQTTSPADAQLLAANTGLTISRVDAGWLRPQPLQQASPDLQLF